MGIEEAGQFYSSTGFQVLTFSSSKRLLKQVKYDPNSVNVAIFPKKSQKQDVFDALELH